jgi:hypothetical protein
MPVAMLIDVLKAQTSDPRVLRIFNLANVSAAALLIGEVVVLLVWWVASAFRREDQTYYGGDF